MSQLHGKAARNVAHQDSGKKRGDILHQGCRNCDSHPEGHNSMFLQNIGIKISLNFC
jgi:hypothetical protein